MPDESVVKVPDNCRIEYIGRLILRFAGPVQYLLNGER